jgi:hypothetical protein
LYPLPPQGRLIAASGYSSPPGLLPTPVVTNRAGMEHSPSTAGGKRGTDLGPAIGELLKTPTAQLAVNGGSQPPAKRRAGGHGPTLADQVEHELLPTPAAADGNGNGVSARGREGGPSLAGMLLPTPNATDGKGGNVPVGRMRGGRPRAITDGDLPAVIALLPTPAAHDSGNTPENHLAKKPGRSQVTSLAIIAENGLLPTGGRTGPLSSDGSES